LRTAAALRIRGIDAGRARADPAEERRNPVKQAVVLMRFLRHDPVGQRLGVGVLVLMWLAIAWTSLGVLAAVVAMLGVCELVRRKRENIIVVADDLEDLY
jgi:hypothetical protein